MRCYKIKMSKDYTQKIRNLLNSSTHTVPYAFQRFYLVLKSITMNIRHDNNDPKIFEQYSLIYRTVKKYIVDEPSLLLANSDKIDKELKTLINPFFVYMSDDQLSKRILAYFADKEIVKKVEQFLLDSDKVRAELLAKNLKLKVFGTHEMANAFWLINFKNQYAVHVDTFWNSFLKFVSQIDFFEYFISLSSKKSIIRKVDPDKKYFVTSSNVTQLFYKLSQPDFLEKLADQTAKGQKPVNFSSKDFFEMKFLPYEQSAFQTDLKKGEVFELSGEDTMIEGKKASVKHAPTIIFGSSVDSDIKIKNKYVSRKQFMVIEEEEEKLVTKEAILPFSLVCLSSSNFTMLKYNREVRLRTGMIFRAGENAVQVVKVANCMRQAQKFEDKEIASDEDETLEHLPTKSSLEISQQKQLEYTCISGPQKGIKGQLSKDDSTIALESPQAKVSILYKNNEFHLPPGVRIYVKTANQVINGELSDKVPLQEGMKVVLEECEFEMV